MKPEQASFDKESLIKSMSGELRQWVTLLYLKLSISGSESMEVRPMKESVLREMDKLSLVEFRDVFREMFDSIDSHTERLKAVVQKLDEVLPPYGQAALHFELHALDRRRGRVIEVKPEVEQTAQKVRKVVSPKPDKEAGSDLGRLPVHIEQYFTFTEEAREKEAAIVAASQERISYLLEIQK